MNTKLRKTRTMILFDEAGKFVYTNIFEQYDNLTNSNLFEILRSKKCRYPYLAAKFELILDPEVLEFFKKIKIHTGSFKFLREENTVLKVKFFEG